MSTNLITDLFKVIDASDWAGMAAMFCDDIVYERPGYPPIVGFAQLLHFYQHVRIIAAGEHQLDHIVIDDKYGSCWGRFVGYRKDHAPIDELFSDVYTFENGKIKQRRSYFFQPAI